MLPTEIRSFLSQFDEAWVLDLEFSAPPGEHPTPLCLVAHELIHGRVVKIWFNKNDIGKTSCPFNVGHRSLVIAFYASAEISCFIANGWPIPFNILDLYVEFRNYTNGIVTGLRNNLLGALAYFGLPSIAAAEKKEMQELALRGGEYTNDEKAALIDYCETDVVALKLLLPKLLPTIRIEHALLRGAYMAAAAQMEWNGIPIDIELLDRLDRHWEAIQQKLIDELGSKYGIFEGRTFKKDLFVSFLIRNNIPWFVTENGDVDLSEDAFRAMSTVHPAILEIHQLRQMLSKLRLKDFEIGSDGRNRRILSAFSSRTGRNQPSNSKFIFGAASWLRGLAKPSVNRAIAYIDWGQQEHGIAAKLSGDLLMQQAYLSGDPYLEFAKQANAVPSDATKKSHPEQRSLFKECKLAIQYSMGPRSLSQRIDKPLGEGQQLLNLHRQTYKRFWLWSDSIFDALQIHGKISTVFGWNLHLSGRSNPRMVRNFPMQSNGAEMLRLACIIALQKGVTVCAPIHDAILIEASIDKIDAHVKLAQEAMLEASRIVLEGFELRTDVEIIKYPDRYMPDKGIEFWSLILNKLQEIENG